MKCLVTGCAGFIGSNLTDQLLEEGHDVTGIDCFTDYYSERIKKENIAPALENSHFVFIAKDILELTTYPEVDVVFHLAAQAGVRASWGSDFSVYTRNNIEASQRLLEYYKDKSLKKFVYASSSSVYGDVPLPMHEDMRLQPVSPYGVTKTCRRTPVSLILEKFWIANRFTPVFYGLRSPPATGYGYQQIRDRDPE